MKTDDAHKIVCDHIAGAIKSMVAEMRHVAILLDAAGYQNKYVELDDAADMAEEWANELAEDVEQGLLFHDLKKLDDIMGYIKLVNDRL